MSFMQMLKILNLNVVYAELYLADPIISAIWFFTFVVRILIPMYIGDLKNCSFEYVHCNYRGTLQLV